MDLTWITANICHKIISWQVLDEVTLSDHLYIFFKLDINDIYNENNDIHNERRKKMKYTRWCHKKMDTDMFVEALEWQCAEEKEFTVDNAAQWLTETMTQACDSSMLRAKPQRKSSMYWWNNYIAKLRKECNKCRRQWQKSKRKRDMQNIQNTQILAIAYRSAQRALKLEIAKAKASAWGELLSDLDRDPWGSPVPPSFEKTKEVTTFNDRAPG